MKSYRLLARGLTTLSVIAAATLLLGLPSTAPASDTPTLAPENPAFLDYILHPEVIVQQNWDPSAFYASGLVPEPINLQHLQGYPTELDGPTLLGAPISYDLRPLGKLTPIRNQGSCGSCWSFATMGSLESSLMPGENWDFSENNLKNKSGFDIACCSGGNRTMSTAYLTRWGGPVAESDDPYNQSSCSSPSSVVPRKHVQDVIYLPTRSGPLDNEALKQAVMTYGAVYTTYYHSDSYYNSSTRAYYYGGGGNSNHAVCIVGWDDNFSRTNFRTQPSGDGAFLIRNSWGAYWGDAGYFYISYYDSLLGKTENAVFQAEPATNYDAIYQYDPLGWISNTGYGSTTAWFANVFTATASSKVVAASWYSSSPGSNYELYVYLNPTSGPVGASAAGAKSGTISTAGYHTVKLDTGVPITAGQKFSVVVKLTTPGYSYPIPLERPYSGYASAASASAGQSYMSSNGSSWTDVASYYANTNVCLKAFTSNSGGPGPDPGPGVLSVSPASGLTATGDKGGPFSPSAATYTLSNTGQTAINWTASKAASWVSLSNTGGSLQPGATASVTVTVGSGANSLAAGSYSDTVSFINTTNGTGNTTRTVSLTVNDTAPAPGALSVSPTTGLSANGDEGGPFSPSAATYTLSNTGQTAINWTASKAASWVSLSNTGGSLQPGATASVTVTVGSGANSLAAGSYSDTVSFINTTNGTGNTTRTISLTVKPKAPAPGAMSVTPDTGFDSTGPVRGPFSPTSMVYTVKNTGSTAIYWQATRTQNWTVVSPSSGMLPGGSSVNVTVSIGYYSSWLAAGDYKDTISFVNATNGGGNTTRTVSLKVGSSTPPPPTPDPGALSVTPTSGLSASGAQGGPFSPSSATYTLSNTGGSAISWTASSGASWASVSSAGGTLNPGASTNVTVSINSQANSLNAGSYTGSVSFVNSTNGAGNTSRSISLSVTGGGGGGGESTYRVVPETFKWIDSTYHTRIAMSDNSVASQYMPFVFSFYGKDYNRLYIGSNGLMSFIYASLTGTVNTDLPYLYYPNAAIYPYWDDLNPSAGGTVTCATVGYAPSRQLVISWNGVPHKSSPNAKFSFQAILCEGSNDIIFQYRDVASGDYTYGGGRSATIGIESDTGKEACKFSYNAAGAVANGTAIRFTTSATTQAGPRDFWWRR